MAAEGSNSQDFSPNLCFFWIGMMVVVPTFSPIDQCKEPIVSALILGLVIWLATKVIYKVQCTAHAPGDGHGSQSIVFVPRCSTIELPSVHSDWGHTLLHSAVGGREPFKWIVIHSLAVPGAILSAPGMVQSLILSHHFCGHTVVNRDFVILDH